MTDNNTTIQKELSRVGLRFVVSHSLGEVYIKDKEGNTITTLTGSQLSVNYTPQQSLDVIKEALKPYGYAL